MSSPRPYPERVAALLDSLELRAGARVAVVERAASEVGESVLAERPGAHVTGWQGLSELHVELAARGPFDLVLDLVPGGSPAARLPVLLAHLAADGTAVLRLPRPGGGTDAARTAILDLVGEVGRLAGSDALDPPGWGMTEGRPDDDRDLHALAAGCTLEVSRGFVVARQRVEVRATVSERRVDELLNRAPERGRVLEVVAGETWASRGRFRSSDEHETRPASYTAPDLALREFRDVICAPRQVALQGHLVLPASFRNPVRKRPRTRSLREWSRYSVVDPGLAEPARRAGAYFHADNVMRGHFGHCVTEQLSHLWAWERAKRLHPDLRLLVFEWAGHPMAEWEYRLLEAAGVDRRDVVVEAGPVLVETLVAATPAYAIGPYAHPVLRPVHDRVVDSLAGSGRAPTPARLFLTRTGEKRRCHNGGEVEALFRDHGFEVVLPEQHDLADQLAMVRDADVVAGFAGSGLFPVGLVAGRKHMIVVGSEGYPMANERQLAAFAGHDLDVVRCRADVSGEHHTLETFHSDFTFDPEREGRFLRNVLSELSRGSA